MKSKRQSYKGGFRNGMLLGVALAAVVVALALVFVPKQSPVDSLEYIDTVDTCLNQAYNTGGGHCTVYLTQDGVQADYNGA